MKLCFWTGSLIFELAFHLLDSFHSAFIENTRHTVTSTGTGTGTDERCKWLYFIYVLYFPNGIYNLTNCSIQFTIFTVCSFHILLCPKIWCHAFAFLWTNSHKWTKSTDWISEIVIRKEETFILSLSSTFNILRKFISAKPNTED